MICFLEYRKPKQIFCIKQMSKVQHTFFSSIPNHKTQYIKRKIEIFPRFEFFEFNLKQHFKAGGSA